MSEEFRPGWRGLPRYPDPVPGPDVSPRSVPPPPPEPPGRQWPVVVAAAVVLVSVAVFAVIGNRVGLPADPAASGSGASMSGATSTPTDPATPGPPAQATTPADAVAGFLQAVADGDLNRALSYSADPPPDSPLLTAEVFTQAQQAAPLTDITVPPASGPTPLTTVSALYRVGGDPVAQSFGVRQVGDFWKLDKVTAELDLSPLRSGGLPLSVNGAPIETDVVAALPGAYSFSTGLEFVTFANRGVLTVTGPSTRLSSEVGPTVTEAGKEAAVGAAKKSFESCLKVKAINPKNCPFSLQDRGLEIRKDTIVWTVEGDDPFAKAKVTAAGAVASVTVTYRVKLTASCAGFTQCSGTDSGTNTARINLVKQPLKLKWLA